MTSSNKINELPQNAKILIVLGGALGDIARAITVPSIIKRERPDIEITWLVDSKWRSFLTLCPAVDNLVGFDRSKPLSAIFSTKKILRKLGPFDCSLDLQRHLKSGLLTRLGGAKRRLGFSSKDAKECNWLFNNEYIKKINNSESKVYHYLHFLEYLGFSEYKKPFFAFNKEECVASVEEFFIEKTAPFFSFVLGSSWASKDWTEEGYREAIQRFVDEKSGTAVLLGDRTQVALAAKLEEVRPSRILNLVGKTNLAELCGAIGKSDLLIGPDTGPGHIAALFEKKYIGLFGPTDPARVAPYGSEHLVLTADVPCRPCWKRECPGLGGVCMSKQSVEAIAALSSKLI